MSLIKLIKAQLGLSSTATQNFTLDASAQDGTMKLARGNAGATTQDILTVSAAGVVKAPQNQVAFSVYQSLATAVSAFTPTKVQLQTKEFDTTAAFDNTTNYRFQPTVAGYYLIDGNVLMATTACSVYASVYKNGSEYKRGAQHSPSGASGAVSAIVYLNGSSDYIELWAYFSIAQNTGLGQYLTYLQGHLLSAS